MEIVGRVTADAKVTETKTGRQVVHFSIAVNDQYKPKGGTEVKKITTYYECSYWVNPGIAQYLTKGTLVELSGRIGVNAYINRQGEAVGRLTLHVGKVTLHGKQSPKATAQPATAEVTGPVDDLPF